MNTPFYYYTILEIPNEAPLADIKRAYRKKALQFHPDKCKDPASAEKFKEINQAFHVLSDADKRSCYDNFGGVERPEMPITIAKPFEEFCEGVALGTFSILANLGFVAVFGTPMGMGIRGWLLATQLITAWQMDAHQLSNWTKSIGALLSPVFLLTSASCCAGYLLLNGGRLAIDYTRTKVGEMSTTLSDITEQVKRRLEALQPSKKQLSLALDDWVMLEEEEKKTAKKKKTRFDIATPAVELPKESKVEQSFSLDSFESISNDSLDTNSFEAIEENSVSTSSNQSNGELDWVLLDDL